LAKYKQFRFPLDAWEKWFGKKQKIEHRIKMKTNKNIKVSMTDVLRFYGNQQKFEWDDNVLPYFTKKKHRRKMEGEVL